MRTRLSALLISVAMTCGLVSLAPAAHAAQAAPGPLDIVTDPFITPPGYPGDMMAYSKVGRYWGRVEQVLPRTLGNGFGVNNGSSAQATNCIPNSSESAEGTLTSFSRAFIDGYCRLHPGQVTFNVGTTAAPSDQGKWEYAGSDRRLFTRISSSPDCLSAPRTEERRFLYALTTADINISQFDLNSYLCVAQGFTVRHTDTKGINAYYWTKLRSPWTVFKIASMSDQARATNVHATPGDARATITWDYDRANLAGMKFVAHSYPQDKTCEISGATGCVISGLTNGTAYTFTVTAANGLVSSTSDRTAPVVPVARATAGAGGSGAAATASTLSVNPPSATPVRGNTVEPLTVLQVATTTTGALGTNESVATRRLYACLTDDRGNACRGERRMFEQPASVGRKLSFLWIPRNAGGKFIRTWFTIRVGTTLYTSGESYTYVRNVAAQNGQVAGAAAEAGVPAGADPGLLQAVPQNDAAAGAADAAAPAAGAGDPAESAPAATADAAGTAAADSGAAAAASTTGQGADAARAAGIDLSTSPVADANGQGTGASAGLSMQLAASAKVNRGRFITMKAALAPKSAQGRVRIALVRTNAKGAYISSKSIYAPVKKGIASKRWRIPRTYAPATFTLVVSYEPKAGGAGITRTAPVVIQ